MLVRRMSFTCLVEQPHKNTSYSVLFLCIFSTAGRVIIPALFWPSVHPSEEEEAHTDSHTQLNLSHLIKSLTFY